MVQNSSEKVIPRSSSVETLRLSNKLTVNVIFEDRYFMAIDKPSGYLVAPVSWEQTKRNLMLMLREGVERGTPWARRRHLRFIANVHRIDADTSGVLLLAKNRVALSQMTARFERRRVEKSYITLVEGVAREEQFKIEFPLAQHPEIVGRMVVDYKEGREAITEFKVLERFSKHTLLMAQPITGRTHQIRVHLAKAGLPVVADPLYGLRYGEREEDRPIMDRLALHSIYMDFKHPFTQQKVHIEAPLAKDIYRVLDILRKR